MDQHMDIMFSHKHYYLKMVLQQINLQYYLLIQRTFWLLRIIFIVLWRVANLLLLRGIIWLWGLERF